MLKHKLGKTNKEANVFNQRVALLGRTTIHMRELESLKNDYEVNENFFYAWKVSKET